MDSSNEQHFDLSEYRVISIEENHKIAIINILNAIVAEPHLEDTNDTKAVVWKLAALVELFDDSFITSGVGAQNRFKLKDLDALTESDLLDISTHVRNWLISYYNAESLIGNEVYLLIMVLYLNMFGMNDRIAETGGRHTRRDIDGSASHTECISSAKRVLT